MVQIIPPIPVNNPITWLLSFTDANNVAFDPVTVRLIIVDGDGVEATYTYPADPITKTAVGNYSLVTQATVVGDWVGKGQGTLADGTVLTTPDAVQSVIASNVP